MCRHVGPVIQVQYCITLFSYEVGSAGSHAYDVIHFEKHNMFLDHKFKSKIQMRNTLILSNPYDKLSMLNMVTIDQTK